MALTGRLDVDFTREPIIGDDGVEVFLSAPSADELPSRGFDAGESGFIMPAVDGSNVSVSIKPGSDRLEALMPFTSWDGEDFTGLRVLMKATGKCTTDHISPAGQWLKYRGHLTNISQNLYIGANNAFALNESGQGIDVRDGSVVALPDLAKKYKDAGIDWIAIGDENFGEGSSREHAAMEPRYMGACDSCAFIRPHPRGKSEEARHAAAYLCARKRLRAHSLRRLPRRNWACSACSRSQPKCGASPL